MRDARGQRGLVRPSVSSLTLYEGAVLTRDDRNVGRDSRRRTKGKEFPKGIQPSPRIRKTRCQWRNTDGQAMDEHGYERSGHTPTSVTSATSRAILARPAADSPSEGCALSSSRWLQIFFSTVTEGRMRQLGQLLHPSAPWCLCVYASAWRQSAGGRRAQRDSHR